MHAYKIMFKGVEVFKTLHESTVLKMLHRGYLVRRGGMKLEFVENPEYKFLFSHKMSLAKLVTYMNHISDKNATCEDCGKDMSFHIRPVIENGQINFKGIVCVCKTCRTSQLNKEDILQPQFRKDFSFTGLNKEVRKQLQEKYKDPVIYEKMRSNKELFNMKRRAVKLYGLSKIVLPPLEGAINNHSEEFIQAKLQENGFESMAEELELSNGEVRKRIRSFLKSESMNCPCCGRGTNSTNVIYTIEHIKPKSRGGSNNLNNFIRMCEDCNKDKGDRTLMEYLLVKHFKALPYRALYIAYEEKENIKAEYAEFVQKVEQYEAEVLASIKEEVR